MSARFRPAARTRINISSGLIDGSGTSASLSAFSSPGFSTTTAFMSSPDLSVDHFYSYHLPAVAVVVKLALVECRRAELRHDVVRKAVTLERVTNHIRFEFAAAVLVVKKSDSVITGRKRSGEHALSAGVLNRCCDVLQDMRVVAREACRTRPQRAHQLPVVVSKPSHIHLDTPRHRVLRSQQSRRHNCRQQQCESDQSNSQSHQIAAPYTKRAHEDPLTCLTLANANAASSCSC